MRHGAGYSVRTAENKGVPPLGLGLGLGLGLARTSENKGVPPAGSLTVPRSIRSPYLFAHCNAKTPWPAPGYKQEQVTVTHAPRKTTANTKSLDATVPPFARFV